MGLIDWVGKHSSSSMFWKSLCRTGTYISIIPELNDPLFFLFPKFFFLSVSFWIVSIALSSSSLTFFFNINLFILFIYFWLHWVFIAARGLSLVVASGSYSLLQCMGFSFRWLLLLQSTGSRHVGFSSCGT